MISPAGPAGATMGTHATPPAPPDWFRRRSRTGEVPPVPYALPDASRKVAAAAVPPTRPWPQQAKEWLKSQAGLGLALSIVLHVSLLATLSFWFLDRKPDKPIPLETVLATGEGPGEFDAAAGTAFDLSAGGGEDEAPEAEPLAHLEAAPDVFGGLADANLADIDAPGALPQIGLPGGGTGKKPGTGLAAGLGLGRGHRDGGGDGGPIGSNAVRKGSFTVWTVPANPLPWKPYDIIVQIDVPPGVKEYDRDDLSGAMAGSDSFSMPIGRYRGGGSYHMDYPAGYYGVFNRTMRRLKLTIPGAERLVRDRITVRSALLKETQTIEIVFGRRTRRAPQPDSE